MSQSKKKSDIRGQGNQNVKGTTHVQAIRPNDQNITSTNRPDEAEGKHQHEKPVK